MWIEHIGTIGMVAVILLVAVHFGLHFYFKYQKNKQTKNSLTKNDMPKNGVTQDEMSKVDGNEKEAIIDQEKNNDVTHDTTAK